MRRRADATGLVSRSALGGLLALLLALPATEALAAKKWRTKEGCTLIENEANDGDSFHVRVNKRHYIFRLLWVDTPESDNRFPDRVAEQAAYFGISSEDAIQVGKEAVKFSSAFLAKQPFTVYTQFDDAMGASDKDRDYGVIKSGDTYLMEALVENGLARIFGHQELPDDGPSVNTMRMRLKGLEAEARKNKRGAWAHAGPELSRFEQLNQLPTIAEQTLTTTAPLNVYSLQDAGRLMGTLAAGKEVRVLKAESLTMVRVRFSLSDGRTIEAQCRRADVGL